jgi:iron complex outermembrane receptor protein
LPSSSSPSTAATPVTLAPVVVTGNPLGSSNPAAPVSSLSGDALVLRRGSSLGETLNGLPGVSSTYFGPNASRPVIRGLDGERVRVMNNAAASMDASTLSFDHAVPIDPLVVDRIEVLRGPATLLYGGNAIGGVVNALDNRIPREPLDGIQGSAEVRAGGAERERGGAAVVEAGNGRLAVHADAFSRDTADLRVPRHVPNDKGTPLPQATRIRNSASNTQGGALGGTVFFDQGQFGVAADTYQSGYGVVAEEDVRIRMKRDHVGLAGELRSPDGAVWRKLRVNLNGTRYEHEEVEGTGEVGTVFKTRGNELRVEAEHAPLGPVKGVLGAQVEAFNFSALGEEAFVPTTRTRREALFMLEELPWTGGTLSAGLRLEHARIESDGDTDPAAPRFGPPTGRSFTLRSASLGNVFKPAPHWALSSGLSFTERAPTSFELFANGVHAATGSYERGDSSLGSERGTNLDVAATWTSGPDKLRVGAFHTRFSRFISLEASGADIVDGTDTFPEYVFRPVRARLVGVEIEGKHRLLNGAWSLDLSGRLDVTRATNLDTGEPLPRVAPLRAQLGLDTRNGPWSASLEVDHHARQSRVPATDSATDAYTLVHAAVSRRIMFGGEGQSGSDALLFVKLNNVGNTLAYSASSQQQVRALSPLPGRSLKAGVRVNF